LPNLLRLADAPRMATVLIEAMSLNLMAAQGDFGM